MTVDKERVQMLVDALRSGQYPQDVGRLKTPVGYCCLGVATELALNAELGDLGDDAWIINNPQGSVKPVNRQFLHPTVQDWYGFTDSDPMLLSEDGLPMHTAAEMNDSGGSFSEIADSFERTYIHRDPE